MMLAYDALYYMPLSQHTPNPEPSCQGQRTSMQAVYNGVRLFRETTIYGSDLCELNEAIANFKFVGLTELSFNKMRIAYSWLVGNRGIESLCTPYVTHSLIPY